MTRTLVLPSVTLRAFVPDDAARVYAMSLEPSPGETVEVGYAIEERHQGRGRATEAVRGMTEWGPALVRTDRKGSP